MFIFSLIAKVMMFINLGGYKKHDEYYANRCTIFSCYRSNNHLHP